MKQLRLREERRFELPAYDPEDYNVDNDVIEFDFTDDTGGRIPPGDYEAVLASVEKGYTKTDGCPKYDWTFFVIDKRADGFQPRPLVTKLAPNTKWTFRLVVSALGLGQPGQKGRFSKEQAVGRRCIIRLVDDEYNGQISSKIDRVMPHPKGPILD